MKTTNFTRLLIFVFAWATIGATCKKTIDAPSNAAVSKLSASDIDNLVEQEMVLQNIVGIAVGIVENGVVTHTRAYGHKNEARTQTVSTGTVFRWASLSKPLTAVAAFRAIADGHFGLHDKVVDHVSYWPSSGDKDDIKVSHLLSHRSGIVHYGKDADDKTQCIPNAVAIISNGNFNGAGSVARFSHCGLLFTPGTEHCYSTYAYDLLGALIEEATNTDYVAYVNQKVKNVAGLTSLDAFASSPGGFDLDCNLKRDSKNEGNTNIKIPGGGWSSNVRDLARFMQGVINNEFIPTSYALWQDVTFSSDNSNYIYGFKKKTVNGSSYIYHGGAHDDVRTYMGFFPGDGNGVCVMMNTGDSGDAYRVGEKLLKLMGYNFNHSDLPTNDNDGKTGCGETMVSVWRNTGKAAETVVRRGLKHDDFLAERNALQDKGWHLIDMETYLDGAVRKWDGIFKKGGTGTSIWRGFKTNDFYDKWVAENNAGRRLIDLETYKDGTVTKWAGLFQANNSGNYAMFRDFSTDDFGDKYTEMKNAGKKLVDIETYHIGLNRKWAGVWLGTGTSLLNRGYSQDDFIALCRDRVDAGYRLIDVETYVDGAVRKFAGIWEPATEAEARWFNVDMGTWVNDKHNVLIKDGYELLDLEKY